MFRIDTSTAVGAKPDPADLGAEGYFQKGDPASGQQATVVSADWLNMVQEELIALLTATGVAHSKADPTGVLKSVKRLFGGNLNKIIASRALTLDDCGLVLVDATAADVALTLPASNLLAAAAYRFVRIDATTHDVSVTTAAGDFLPDGAGTVFHLHARWSGCAIQADGGSTPGLWYNPNGLVPRLAVYAGNPNGHVAGDAGVAGVSSPDMCWDSSDQVVYVCTASGNAGTATWVQSSPGLSGGVQPIFKLKTADMNSTADQAFSAVASVPAVWLPVEVIAYNSQSAAPSAAVGGIYTGAGKSGTQVVPATEAYADITGANLAKRLDFGAGVSLMTNLSQLFLSLTTPQGAASKLDFMVMGYPLL